MIRRVNLLDLVLPRRCVGCGVRDIGWCAACRAGLGAPSRLERASRIAKTEVYAVTEYQGPARSAVLAYKENGRRELAGQLACAYVTALRALLPGVDGAPLWLLPAPSGRRAAAARGGQHMLRIANRCARTLRAQGGRVTVARTLALGSGVRDSVGLGQAERAANLRTHLRVRRAALPPPRAFTVLLDDVVTTGATAAACAAALRASGVRLSAVLALTATGLANPAPNG